MTGKYKLQYTDASTGERVVSKVFPSETKVYVKVRELVGAKAYTGGLQILVQPKGDERWLTYEILDDDGQS